MKKFEIFELWENLKNRQINRGKLFNNTNEFHNIYLFII